MSEQALVKPHLQSDVIWVKLIKSHFKVLGLRIGMSVFRQRAKKMLLCLLANLINLSVGCLTAEFSVCVCVCTRSLPTAGLNLSASPWRLQACGILH